MKFTTAALTLALALTASAAKNLQNFDGDLGAAAPAVNDIGGDRPFQVDGNAAFDNLQSALVRSCDVQNNQCSNAANSGAADIAVADCQAQQDDCNANAAKVAAAADN